MDIIKDNFFAMDCLMIQKMIQSRTSEKKGESVVGIKMKSLQARREGETEAAVDIKIWREHERDVNRKGYL